MKNFCLNVITMMVIALALSSCGKRPQIITGIKVHTIILNQDINISLQADVNLGNMSFPNVSLPIFHPRTQALIGSVELVEVLGGKNQIKVTMDVTALSDMDAQNVRLPNGNLVPLIANNPSILVPLGKGAQFYLTFTQNAVAIGVAVPLATFDRIGQAVGAVNLFPTFTIDKVMGAAGIFTGNSGQNGFALVADISGYVKMQDIFVPGGQSLNYSAHIPAPQKEEKINSMILDLNRQKKRLQVQH